MVVLYTPPAAERVSRSGLSFGVRAGVGLPGGMVTAPTPATNFGGASTGLASDAFGVMIPITIDITYRLSPHWSVNAYLGVGYATAANCSSAGTDDAACSYTIYRVGGEVQYRVLPDRLFQPWVALGAGWEVGNQFDTDAESGSSQDSTSGFEFAHIALGLDLRALDTVGFGPYFETTFCEYEQATSSNLNGYVHEWFIFGARVRYDTNWLRMRR
jgi:hypothetical protein